MFGDINKMPFDTKNTLTLLKTNWKWILIVVQFIIIIALSAALSKTTEGFTMVKASNWFNMFKKKENNVSFKEPTLVRY